METITGLKAESLISGEKIEEMEAETLRFGEEIQRLIMAAETEKNSFTALLELPSNQAVELLHSPETDEGKIPLEISSNHHEHKPYFCTPTFPSNVGLLERASRFSVYAELKQEPVDSDSNRNSSDPAAQNTNRKSTKRKEREKKGKGSAKKSKSVGDEAAGEGEKLPYVHVRARRGQATDSHSLAERARREKINARMKLLQELVPGCNKISGTAVVLDEIINHVQSLQRQVEFLSMRLAAVNPRIDFNLDSLLGAESGCPMDSSNFPGMVMPLMWPEGQQYQQVWHFDQPVWGSEDSHNFITPENSLLSYDSSKNSASLPPDQVKMEI